jgi:hypothetical protein
MPIPSWVAEDVDQRDFCLYCGTPMAQETGQAPPCRCAANADMMDDLEQQERVDLMEYSQGWPLTPQHWDLKVRVEGRPVRIAQLLAQLNFEGAIRAFQPRVTDTEVLQVVYIRRLGTRLFKWFFCKPQ